MKIRSELKFALGFILICIALYVLSKPVQYRAVARVRINNLGKFKNRTADFAKMEYDFIQTGAIIGSVYSQSNQLLTNKIIPEDRHFKELPQCQITLKVAEGHSNVIFLNVQVTDTNAAEAADLANTLAENYCRQYRQKIRSQIDLERTKYFMSDRDTLSSEESIVIFDSAYVSDSAVQATRPLKFNRYVAFFLICIGATVCVGTTRIIAKNILVNP